MRGIKKYLAGTVLSAAMFFTGAANAMPIPEFDQMALSDRSEYVTRLAEGTANALEAHGNHIDADKVIALFQVRGPQGGAAQFLSHLDKVRAVNKQNAANPNNTQPAFEVEHALALTLKDNGITVPISVLLSINKNFKPSAKLPQ